MSARRKLDERSFDGFILEGEKIREELKDESVRTISIGEITLNNRETGSKVATNERRN